MERSGNPALAEEEYSSSLGWLDFHARMGVYPAVSGDPTIARWHVPDPLASQTPHENPYLYCGGDPVNLTDPTGLSYLDGMINSNLDGFWYRGEHLTNNNGVYYGDDSGQCYGGATGYNWSSGQYTINGQPVAFYEYSSKYIVPKSSEYRYGIIGGYGVGEGPWGDDYGNIVYEYGWYDASDWSDYNSDGESTQPLLNNSVTYWSLTGGSWLWAGSQLASESIISSNKTILRRGFNDIAASKAGTKLIGKIGVGLNWASTIAEGYDLYNNRNNTGWGDVTKFGVDASITLVTTILYISGVGAPIAMILTGIQIANTLGAFDSIYENFNTPINGIKGGGGSW